MVCDRGDKITVIGQLRIEPAEHPGRRLGKRTACQRQKLIRPGIADGRAQPAQVAQPRRQRPGGGRRQPSGPAFGPNDGQHSDRQFL